LPAITPLRGRILINPDVRPDKTASGILMVQNWDPETTGTVVATGAAESCKCGISKPCPVSVGDHVVFSYESGQKVTIEGEDLLVMQYGDVLGVLER
jgi:co-chaperonin GroES (HSP10)